MFWKETQACMMGWHGAKGLWNNLRFSLCSYMDNVFYRDEED